MIEILSNGAANTVQDLGRFGHLDIGVSRCGAMDAAALTTGNALLGNAPSAAGLEIAIFPFRLRFLSDIDVAVTGADCAAALDGWRLPPFWAISARSGQELKLSPPIAGARAYVAFAGGIDVAEILGSRSTDLKSGFGGHKGRGLERGDRLGLAKIDGRCRKLPPGGLGALPLDFPPAGETTIDVRVTPGAEFDSFAQASIDHFFAAPWIVSVASNRMGYRLSGPLLTLKRQRELLSHGILSGTIQVPASGQPIIQLADANTCGGYPKIAHVIEPDLARLAQAPAGARIRFHAATIATALEAAAKSKAHLDDIRVTAALICG